MQYALFDRDFGYYRTKKPIGKESDFITAPEISSLFGETIAIYLLNFILNSKHKIAFVEMGAGLGTLYLDILTTFEKLGQKLGKADEIKQKLTFSIIEISEKLTQTQQEKLKNHNFDIKWHKNFENFAKNHQNEQIYFVSNELFDCLPIHQFSHQNNQWQEILITLKNHQPTLILEEFHPKKHQEIAKIAKNHQIPTQNNIILEYSPNSLNLLTQISQTINKQGGIAINFDYGYLKPPLKSTLQSIKSHQKQDFLQNIGEADLTSLVNFSALQKCAQNHDLETSLITQKQFLSELQIQKRAQNYREKQAVKRLIDEKEMGELFKCLIFWKNII